MLTTLPALQLVPNLKAINAMWLSQLLTEADAAIKSWCKRDLELTSYPGAAVNGVGDAGYYTGMNREDIVLRQYPVLNPQTIIAAGSNNVVLPTSVINVQSTAGFNPSGGTLSINLGSTAQPGSTTVTYTGTGNSNTSFTGCVGGAGTLATNQPVGAVAVWYDPQGMGGQYPGAFGTQTLLTQGLGYFLPTTRVYAGTPGAETGFIKRAGYQAFWGPGCWGGGYGGYGGYDNKLSARQNPYWPYICGQQNLKVAYLAGYPVIPPDLAYACQALIEYMVRTLPVGGNIITETIGSYSYGLLGQAQAGALPELGSVSRTLAKYRDTALGNN